MQSYLPKLLKMLGKDLKWIVIELNPLIIITAILQKSLVLIDVIADDAIRDLYPNLLQAGIILIFLDAQLIFASAVWILFSYLLRDPVSKQTCEELIDRVWYAVNVVTLVLIINAHLLYALLQY